MPGGSVFCFRSIGSVFFHIREIRLIRIASVTNQMCGFLYKPTHVRL